MEQIHYRNNCEDGWDNLSNQSEESVQLISLYQHGKGRPILQQQYSLEPDMATGWIPKLPSCPIPLTYQNNLITSVLQKLDLDPRFKVVYRGPRHINSVQLHKNNTYFWKYRQKYDVKINAISDAISTVGQDGTQSNNIHGISRQDGPQNEITFDSDFESGNLDLAIRIKPSQYDCFIRSDTNTRGHTNWYYFKVNNKKHIGTIQFNICNISKYKNLYNKGMKPYTLTQYRDTPYQTNNVWRQNQCFDVQFVERLCRYSTNNVQNQLQFKFNFVEQNMEVFFAYSIPYSYSQLQSYLDNIKNHPNIKISSLCQSFSGLDLPLITITNTESPAKNNVIIVSRIHPGQTNSSHMLQGFINSLLEKNSLAHKLLYSLNFYIIPMINPDGVVSGNYRTSFSGRDMNRCFNQIGNFLYPELSGLIDFIKRLKAQRKKIQFFFDFHSHSSKKNLFCYGPEHEKSTLHFFRSRILAKTIQRQGTMFNPRQCMYKISEYKKGTARAYMLNKQKIPMTFTFEISNGIYSVSKQAEAKYDKKSLLLAGKIIANGLAEYGQYYHKDIASQPKIKIIKFKDERLSFSINRKSFFNMKNSRKNSKHTDKPALNATTANIEIKNMMEQILEENQLVEEQNQKQSDSQASQHDIQEQELKSMFSVRKSFTIKNGNLKSLQTPTGHSSEKVSLKKIKSKVDLLRPSVNPLEYRDENKNTSSQKFITKQRRSRIYYEQTHPKTSKKVYENPFESKKPIKQKRFPILF